MSALSVLIVLATASLSAMTEAATLSFYQSHGGRVISVFLRGEELNNSIAAVGLSIRGAVSPLGEDAFVNQSSGRPGGVPFPAGRPFTYRNRALDLDPLDLDNPGVGKGWIVLGATQTSTELSFQGGPRAPRFIDTAIEHRGELFLANLYSGIEDPFSSGISWAITLKNKEGGDLLRKSGFLPRFGLPQLPQVPEPSSVVLLAIAGLAALAGRRRTPRGFHVSNPVAWATAAPLSATRDLS
jgi:hypothetical protein